MATAFLAGAFFAAVFLAGAFFAAVFLAGAFFLAAFFLVAFFFFDGPAALRISRSSAARSMVIDSTVSPVRSEAFVVPSVT